MKKHAISTQSAPAAIGTYSQAVRAGDTVYFSGQIPLDPLTQKMVEGDFEVHARRVFDNLKAVAEAAGGSLDEIVKLNIYLLDLGHFAAVNATMADYFEQPYPARAAVAVSQLPKDSIIEIDGVMVLRSDAAVL